MLFRFNIIRSGYLRFKFKNLFCFETKLSVLRELRNKKKTHVYQYMRP